mgnify:CR=1 FL=1
MPKKKITFVLHFCCAAPSFIIFPVLILYCISPSHTTSPSFILDQFHTTSPSFGNNAKDTLCQHLIM